MKMLFSRRIYSNREKILRFIGTFFKFDYYKRVIRCH